MHNDFVLYNCDFTKRKVQLLFTKQSALAVFCKKERKRKKKKKGKIYGSTSETEQIFTLSLSSLSEFLSISGHFSYNSLNTRTHSGHTLNRDSYVLQ